MYTRAPQHKPFLCNFGEAGVDTWEIDVGPFVRLRRGVGVLATAC